MTLTIDATDASGNLTPSAKETVTGVVDTGSSSLVTCLRGLDNTTQQAHSTGANVVQWWTANDWNDFISSFLEGHVQQGGHQSLLDINNHTWLSQTAGTNPVNHLDVANAASGNPIVLSALGSDANIDIDITPKGTGAANIGGLLNVGGNPIDAGAWITWSPSYTNLTVGSGTVVAKYIQIGKTVILKFKFTFASDSSIGTAPTVSFPLPPTTDYFTEQTLGLADFIGPGIGDYTGRALLSGSNFSFRSLATPNVANPVNILSNVANQITGGAPVPFNSLPGSIISTSFSYETT